MPLNEIRVQASDILAVGVGQKSGNLQIHAVNAVAVGGRAAPFIRVSGSNSIAISGGKAVIRVQQVNAVVIGAEGVIPSQPLEINSFQYDIDGHIFYGIHVRGKGTFIFDQSTGQWTQFKSGSLLYWNTQFHLKWDGEYYAASLIDNQIVRVDPDSILDDGFRTNEFVVTARLEYKSRQYVPNSEVQLFGSIGLRGGDVELRYSDDDGHSFTDYRVVNVPENARANSVMFYNLGSVRQPGRIYEVRDYGTIRRIQSLNAKIGDGDGN